MKVNIILFAGKSESGKSTVTRAFLDQATERGAKFLHYDDTFFDRHDEPWSLASPLKRMCAEVVKPYVLHHLLKSGYFHGHSRIDSALKDMFYGALKNTVVKGFGKSPRDLMQFYGDDHCRALYGTDYFVNYLIKQILYTANDRCRLIKKSTRPKSVFVLVDDLRNPGDLSFLRNFSASKNGIKGFKLKVHSVGILRDDVQQSMTDANAKHSSETSVSDTLDECDITFYNKVLPDEYESKLRLQKKVDKLVDNICGKAVKKAPERMLSNLIPKDDDD